MDFLFCTCYDDCFRYTAWEWFVYHVDTYSSSAYQLALYNGLQAWILDAPRVDILSANKEGICSFTGTCVFNKDMANSWTGGWIGYVAIFLLGLDSGMIIFRNDLSQSSLIRWLGIKSDAPNAKHVGIYLMVQACGLWALLGCWWCLCIGDENEMFQVSRRMVRETRINPYQA